MFYKVLVCLNKLSFVCQIVFFCFLSSVACISQMNTINHHKKNKVIHFLGEPKYFEDWKCSNDLWIILIEKVRAVLARARQRTRPFSPLRWKAYNPSHSKQLYLKSHKALLNCSSLVSVAQQDVSGPEIQGYKFHLIQDHHVDINIRISSYYDYDDIIVIIIESCNATERRKYALY